MSLDAPPCPAAPIPVARALGRLSCISSCAVHAGWSPHDQCPLRLTTAAAQVSSHCMETPAALRRDGELRMWNMAKGKCSYHTKLAAPADDVAFAPAAEDGASGKSSVYALLAGTVVSLHSAAGDGTMLHALKHERRALCMAFSGQHTVLTGGSTLVLHSLCLSIRGLMTMLLMPISC